MTITENSIDVTEKNATIPLKPPTFFHLGPMFIRAISDPCILWQNYCFSCLPQSISPILYPNSVDP
jgi:hypothetical protein